MAETVYVSDELEITLRTGPAVKHKILSMLKSGADLEVLQRDSRGYVQVKTVDGKEGWVLQRFLMDTPSARSRLEDVEEREVKLQAQQQEISTLRDKTADGETALLTMQDENSMLKVELKRLKSIASDTLSIHDENATLTEALERAKTEQASLRAENEQLSNNTEQAWFLRGAGVILLGMFLGLIVPKLRFKKKRKWGDFSNY